MTQTPVSLLQGQNTTSSYNTQSQKATYDRRDPDLSNATTLVDPNDSSFYFATDSVEPMNGVAGTAPAGTMYVRALYDYEADDRTSLSFHEGDIIQVITQLESGWWDGVINGVRGWFPSNYCEVIPSPDEAPGETEDKATHEQVVEEEAEDHDVYHESFDEDDASDRDDDPDSLPIEGTDGGRADFWIPQATPDGRLFYYNTMTGESSNELPLESPASINETGPRDRMTVTIPERTRPPPEMMARGLTQDEEDEDDITSASEVEGETFMNASRGSLVSPEYLITFEKMRGSLQYSPRTAAFTMVSHRPRPWILSTDSPPVTGAATRHIQTVITIQCL